MAPTVRAATAADVPALSASLARAFVGDPVMRFLLGGRDLPHDKGTRFFATFAHLQLPKGYVLTTEGAEAAAIWAPPGQWKVSNRTIVKTAPTLFRVFGWRLVPDLQVLGTLEKRHPSEPHYYLEFLGTDPAHQGKGFGSALVEPVLERCDTEGVGAYLESSKESNVAYYARFGFQVREEVTHKRGGPKQWLMWRDPR